MRKTFIYVLWAVPLLAIAAVAAVFAAISEGKIGYVPPVEELENPNLKFATQIISEDGQLLGTGRSAKKTEFMWVMKIYLLIWFTLLLLPKMYVLANIQVLMRVRLCVRSHQAEAFLHAEKCRRGKYHYSAAG